VSKFHQTPKFRQLQKLWYDKLQASGFVDQEVLIAGEPMLRQNASNVYKQAPLVVIENKMSYFYAVSDRLVKNDIPDLMDRYVMSRHAEGAENTEISAELASFGVHRSRKSVARIIRQYVYDKWKIKK
jgi:hypothetical protein